MPASFPRCYQINLQSHFQGGEIFTVFFSRALVALGCPVTLYIARGNRYWRDIRLTGVDLIPVADERALLAALPLERSFVLTNGPVSPLPLEAIARRHFLAGIVHMPAYQRDCSRLAPYHLLCPVSGYVLKSLEDCGVQRLHSKPLYGVSDFDRFGSGQERIEARSPYRWDRRKFRDVLFSMVEPVASIFSRKRYFERGPGLTLGIVSGIAPIKQFPILFRHIAPIIAAQRGVRLEVFGEGGFAQVRDMREALAPIRDRSRFWGPQENPQRIYPQLDYLMSGLPEKEALGLNLIEAQTCGTPVLAVNAPPFTETVLDGQTGFLYRDPRQDGGDDFRRVLARSLLGPRPEPLLARDHLARFSFDAFRARVAELLDRVQADLSECH